jgi:hypothetical protein
LIGLASASSNARPDADGNLKLDNVYAGAYRIIAMNSPAGYYLDSVRVGDAEQSTPEVELSSGAVPITLVYKTNGGTVRAQRKNALWRVVIWEPRPRGRDFLLKPCDSNDRYEIGTVRPGTLRARPSRDGPDPWFRQIDDTVLNRPPGHAAPAKSSVDLRRITPPR